MLDRWQKLKEALIEKRKAISELGTLQQFSRDADEIENWMLEKLVAVEEALDATNIQSKHQKHEAIEMEIRANDDRIKSVLSMGKNMNNLEQGLHFTVTHYSSWQTFSKNEHTSF